MIGRGRGGAAMKKTTTDRGEVEEAEVEAGAEAAAAHLPDRVHLMIEGAAGTSEGGTAAAAAGAGAGAEMKETGGIGGIETGTAIVITDGRGGAAARVARSAIEQGGGGIAIDAMRGNGRERGTGRGAALARKSPHRTPRPLPPSHWAPRHRASTSPLRGCAPCRRTSKIGRAPSTSV